MIERDGYALKDADLNFNTVTGRSLLYLAGELGRIPATKTRRPLITAVTNLRQIMEIDPSNPLVVVQKNDREGLKYRLRADLDIFEDNIRKQKDASSLKWKLFNPNPAEETQERGLIETAILITLTNKLLTGRKIYFDELHRSLSFIGLAESRPEGGIRIRLLTAQQLKSDFQQTYLKFANEAENPKVRVNWTQEDEETWKKLKSLKERLKAQTPTQLFDRVGKKLLSSEEDFYKSFEAGSNIRLLDNPYIDIDL